ncbi:hypothetical protein LTR08_005737 [Meristemomyces frigidus]|nr:hypothetical protein LTR08_005737 [Meristemomyces frigidus]
MAAMLVRDREPVLGSNATTEDLLRNLEYCKSYAKEVYSVLAASASISRTSIARGVQQWPRLSPTMFLQQLSHRRWSDLSESWKKRIVEYGIALTALQRAERLVNLTDTPRKDDLVNELRNIGHTNWSPYDRPESLLMEVESGITIRKVQEDIGKQMREPEYSRNAVMQLNMGEGKSSVIAPMVAATLADSHRLVRVIVAKPQSKQMAQMLIAKLGGLVDRRIYYLPFSRTLKLDTAAAEVVDSILHECMRNRGILLVQPEHVLSFKLMVPECYISGKEEVGRQLMRTQDFLDQHARDIVDESDENFSVRFELIYTMGMQSPIELSPDRWFFVQQVLDLVKKFAPTIAEQHPGSLEVHLSPSGGVPRVRILRADIESVLVSCIAVEICKNGLDGLQISRQPETVRNAVFNYITKFELDDAEISAVEGGVFWTESTKAPLLLLRGILAGGVLIFTLGQKRWRVNYGLASRTPSTRLAVPYRAKDSPSLRSEFSHPDVVIILTSLCFYYEGLHDEDLFTALAHLVDSDQADIEYQAWIKDTFHLPCAFKQLQGVNLEDRLQCVSKLFPALRYGKSVVDYFLSHIVFPKEMKEFPHKLSASGWDIGKRKTQPTTGFSGTNDSRCLLPLDVEHLDLDEQKHTNALVLEYLLQDGNLVKLMAPGNSNLTDAESLLSMVTQFKLPVQVILDVGAQILELNNLEVAKTWLKMSNSSKEAVVFVNGEDELCVIDRKDRIDLLQTSSFAARLDSCLVFLDESHTRGIDLKLPVHYRAAVTLGANLTKDRLVQASMRMRKLGKGQTVVFCIPLEIQTKIRGTKSDPDSEITVADVLLWSIAETHTEMRRGMPLWAVQGQRYIRQEKLWQQIMQNGKTTLTKSHAEQFLEEEAQSLEHRYRPHPSQSQSTHLSNTTDVASQLLINRCREFDHLQFSSSTLQEEQERELSPEIEQQRQIQRAPPAMPATHHLHPEVEQFALLGAFSSLSKAYTTAFESLCRLSIADALELSQLAGEGNLLVSTDFADTVKQHAIASVSDAFQRHVSWLLTKRAHGSNTVEYIMIISPYEANLLHPHMRSSPNTLHVYKPRANSGYAALDGLGFHTVSVDDAPPIVPRALAVQLNLFAGQLYISSYADYLEICRFLGLSAQHPTKDMEDQGWQVDADGFILRDEQGRVGGVSGVTRSPINFLKVLMSKIRRNGDGIAKTHMGSLLEGKLFQTLEWEG